MAKMLSCDGISLHIQGLEKPTQRAGKAVVGTGSDRKEQGFTYKLFCQILCHFLLWFPVCLSYSLLSNLLTVGRPQPISPSISLQETKILLQNNPLPSVARQTSELPIMLLLCEVEDYIIFLSHLPDSQSVWPLWSSHSFLQGTPAHLLQSSFSYFHT